jgi:hypothetical protein
MFPQQCAILWELVCTFWVTCQFVFLVNNILWSMYILCGCLVAVDRHLCIFGLFLYIQQNARNEN